MQRTTTHRGRYSSLKSHGRLDKLRYPKDARNSWNVIGNRRSRIWLGSRQRGRPLPAGQKAARTNRSSQFLRILVRSWNVYRLSRAAMLLQRRRAQKSGGITAGKKGEGGTGGEGGKAMKPRVRKRGVHNSKPADHDWEGKRAPSGTH